MSNASTPAIAVSGLTKVYQARSGPKRAVDNLDLTIEPGQVFGLLGMNGAGKTTTIKMMCGLITPTAGSVRVHGHDVRRARRQAMSRIGVVLEGARNIHWQLSAWDNLRYFARIKGCRGRSWQPRAEQLLKELSLWDRRDDPVAQFSRGMQQKVAIACALAADPPVILLDEPTLGLDTQSAHTVRTWVERLAGEQGKTVLLTSHQLDVVQALSDRVAVIHQGRLLVDAPMKELLSLFRRDAYQIRLGGRCDVLPDEWSRFKVSEEDGEIHLTGEIDSQEDLHEALATARRRSLTVLSVNRLEPTLEEVFLKVVDEGSEVR